ncbi:plastin-2 fimbrin [Brevipalpus obovatus]|uniref:plastin-2 fimbrin n=1 Tax=Brevipalpus obovatus TaxID=246614 RepID=UPI003D9DC0EA
MTNNLRKSLILNDEHRAELGEKLRSIGGDGSFDMTELKDALDVVGLKIPQWQVRTIIEDLEKSGKCSEKRLSFVQFQNLCSELKSKDIANSFKTAVSKRNNLETIGGNSTKSSEGTTHSVRQEEQVAFSDWVNSNLHHDPDLSHILPIDHEGKALYDKVEDGILLCKIINHSCPDTIDERAINKKKNLKVFEKHENLTLALNSANSIGCNIINIGAQDLLEGKPHLVLGLLWQIIRIGLFNQITLEQCPGLIRLLLPTEDLPALNKLSPEAILLRWVNYHLEKAGVSKRISDFSNDIKDSEAYIHLLKQIAPPECHVTKEGLYEPNLTKRAEFMLEQADKLGCRSFLTPNDVVHGIYKLNLAFVANLFNTHPGLDKPDQEPLEIEYEKIEESREEKTYRNWMNSMGVKPFVNWLYSDLADGLVIFQLFDVIKPGLVGWKRVHERFSNLKGFMERLENCNYAVELGHKFGFSLVGIAGQDIADGNPTLTLAIIWQLMRAYTLSVLADLASVDEEANGERKAIAEIEIVNWVNSKLKEAGKTTSISSFQDKNISNALPVIDLVDAIKPGSINYDQVLPGETPEERLANAKYAISMARKIGARIYALPEDIAEVKAKLVLTVFACLMSLGYATEPTE